MFVSEILKENEFTVTQAGRNSWNILNPDGQVVGNRSYRGAAEAEARKLTSKLKGTPVNKNFDKNQKLSDFGKTGKGPVKKLKKPTASVFKQKGRIAWKKAKQFIGPKMYGAGPIFFLFMDMEKFGRIIYIFNREYVASGCDGKSMRVNKAQLLFAEEVTGTFIGAAASFAAGKGAYNKVKKIKNIKNALHAISNLSFAAPLVGFVLKAILFVGIEAAFYAIGKMLGSSKFAEGLANVFLGFFTKETLVQLGKAIYTDELDFSKCSMVKDLNKQLRMEDITYESKVSASAVKADVIDIVKDDPKLLKLVKTVQQKSKEKKSKE